MLFCPAKNYTPPTYFAYTMRTKEALDKEIFAVTMPLEAFIALLRGINVGGHNKIPMAELRALCADLGWGDVQSYIQSGNFIFKAADSPTNLEVALEQAIQRHFDLSIPVIVRTAADWHSYIDGNPFPDASQRDPNLVMLALSKAPPNADAAQNLQDRAANAERIALIGDALWLHYPEGSGRSKLSPSLFDRLVGSPVTTRNWRTVLKLDELAR
jgi:uncharacterized protein (DUF1697 family)